ncbi:LETM1 domain-containing protein 1 [Phlebotomus argentipes]|uniref:LETM1 domain-containing protein 1 n=1 Tax=Phlebotomus argentipes TaxID=94469 RepID=UPI0028931878|nr:LETM1 domain-containing protein 1 [Phlebotomus argentipes]
MYRQLLRVPAPSLAPPARVSFGAVAQRRLESSDGSSTPGKGDKEPKTSKYSRANVRKNVRGYVFTRYFDYLQNYDKVLEKKFPAAMHVYRVFMVGVKDFFSDTKKFLKITRIVNTSPAGLRALTRKEMELYYQMPRDMMKVAPVLLISALPFANYVIFPLAYMYPRYFLTSHFWDIRQKSEFQQLYLKERITHNRRIFRYLQAKLELLRPVEEDFTRLANILGLLGSGLHPTAQEILASRHIFAKPPYNMGALSSGHVGALCHLHGVRTGLLKRARLSERFHIFRHMDRAIKHEGGVHNMSPDALKHACFLRGLNPTLLSNEQMIEWLREWVTVSLAVDTDTMSLFLHLPILIAYNHPNNWRLTHK